MNWGIRVRQLGSVPPVGGPSVVRIYMKNEAVPFSGIELPYTLIEKYVNHGSQFPRVSCSVQRFLVPDSIDLPEALSHELASVGWKHAGALAHDPHKSLGVTIPLCERAAVPTDETGEKKKVTGSLGCNTVEFGVPGWPFK